MSSVTIFGRGARTAASRPRSVEEAEVEHCPHLQMTGGSFINGPQSVEGSRDNDRVLTASWQESYLSSSTPSPQAVSNRRGGEVREHAVQIALPEDIRILWLAREFGHRVLQIIVSTHNLVAKSNSNVRLTLAINLNTLLSA